MKLPERLHSISRRHITVIAAAVVVGVLVSLTLGGMTFPSTGCSWCHSMQPHVTAHEASSHVSVECRSCHATPGVLGPTADGLRIVRWLLAEPFADGPGVVSLSDRPCMSCHTETLHETITGSVRVRHEDFADEPCATCHGGTSHTVEGRFYIGAQMEDCMSCHRVSVANLVGCEACHPDDTAPSARSLPTAWKASHGAGWEQAHGMGDLRSCPACHAPSVCEKCHGVGLPHPSAWSRSHGLGLTDAARADCVPCHQEQWCMDCHGVPMPHPVGFLPVHGPAAEENPGACDTCHSAEQCDYCHYRSSHPDVPGTGMSLPGGDTGAR